MEEAPENSKESMHSAHANGMKEWQSCYMLTSWVIVTVGQEGGSVVGVRPDPHLLAPLPSVLKQ